jgi:hypothetical protein
MTDRAYNAMAYHLAIAMLAQGQRLTVAFVVPCDRLLAMVWYGTIAQCGEKCSGERFSHYS